MVIGENVILDAEQCQELISFAEPKLCDSTLGTAMIGGKKTYAPNKRISQQTFKRIGLDDWLFPIINSQLTSLFDLQLKEDTRFLCNIIKYPTGGFLYKHDDTNHEGIRIVGIGNLNEGYEGGDFATPDSVLKPELGNLGWIWPKTIHEVTKVTSGERWSLVVWIFNHDLVSKNILI